MHNLFPAEKRVKHKVCATLFLVGSGVRSWRTPTPDLTPSGLLHGKKGNHLMGDCPFCIWGLDMQISFGYFSLTRAKKSDFMQANC